MTPTPDESIRVVLTDDHKVVREGLRSFLDAVGGFEVVGEAADGGAAVSLVETLCHEGRPPHVVLMDIVMTPVDGIEATRSLKAAHADIDVIAMTSFVDEARVVAALEAGATGYLLKDAGADEVAEAIRATRRGEVHIDPGMAKLLMQRLREPREEDPLDLLTEREREVLSLVARGQANKQIAVALDISERTARTHVSNILAKLDLHSRTQAALYAVRAGLVDV
jgi:DNA-binding NarL/FixJ family response regulator